MENISNDSGNTVPTTKRQDVEQQQPSMGMGMIPNTQADPKKPDLDPKGGLMPNDVKATPMPVQDNNGGLMPGIAPTVHVGPGGEAAMAAEKAAAAEAKQP